VSGIDVDDLLDDELAAVAVATDGVVLPFTFGVAQVQVTRIAALRAASFRSIQ
jgi:hypothetical protein